MHLQQHLSLQRALIEPIVDIDHRALDDVGGSALHRRIDGGALGGLAQHAVAGMNIGQVEAATKQGLDIAFLVRQSLCLVHIAAHAGVFLEVAVDIVTRLAAAHANLLGEPEGGHAVDETEVNCLSAATLVGRHLV